MNRLWRTKSYVAIALISPSVFIGCENSKSQESRSVLSPDHATSGSDSMTSWEIETSKLVFSATRGGISNLYVLDRATNETTQLTTFASKQAGANNGRLSPDGSKLVFQVIQPGIYDIHLMSTSGGQSTGLITDPAYDVSPVWSPDGKKVAFMSTRGFQLGSIGPFPGHVYIQDLQRGILRQITKSPLTGQSTGRSF